MTSFNHYAFGAIADWLHRVVAGLAPAEPGYRRLAIAPRPLAGLDWAGTEHETPYGRAAVGWERAGGSVIVRATRAPRDHRGGLAADGGRELEVGSGEHGWEVVPDEAAGSGAGPASLDTRLADIMDDPEAYAGCCSTNHATRK